MPGRNGNAGSYRYGMQGQEMDNEIKGTGNSVNFEHRFYDPRLGKFLSMDPLAPKYPQWSPYVFSGNQVIHTLEIEGLEPKDDLNTWAGKAGYADVSDQYAGGYASQVLQVPDGDKIYYVAVYENVGKYHNTYYRYWDGNTWADFTPTGHDLVGEIEQPKNPQFDYEGFKGGQMPQGSEKIFAVIFAVGVTMPVWLEGVAYLLISESVAAEIGREIFSEYLGVPIFKGGGYRRASGYANRGKLYHHLMRRKEQGYKFENTDQMESYGNSFFTRKGDNIREFTDNKGNVHRLDNDTQEYGILQPDGKVQSVYKVIPKPNSSFKDGMDYMNNQIKKNGR